MKNVLRAVSTLLLTAWMIVGQGRADVLTWMGGTNVWHAAENWSNLSTSGEVRVPADGDSVVVTQANARVILSETSARLDSLIISNATVSSSNWVTTLYATNLTIRPGGILTCEGPFTNNVMSNRVNVVCENVFVEAGGKIYTDGLGYAGGSGFAYAPGHGPGGSGPGSGYAFYGRFYYGASHGGAGRNGRTMNAWIVGVPELSYLATNVYGSAEAPLLPGSGGHGPSGFYAGYIGGSGGGAVRIDAVSVVVNGQITANAVAPVGTSYATAGSGGSVYITCDTFHGTNGTVSAAAGTTGRSWGGGGGGGRIAVAYQPSLQSQLPVPSVTFSVAPSLSGGTYTTLPGDIGTLWFPDAYFFSPTHLISCQWLSPEPTELTLSDWAVSNVWVRFPSVTNVIIENTLTVAGTDFGQHKLEFTSPTTLRCGQATVDGATLAVGNVLLERTPSARNPHREASEGSALLCAGDLSLTNAAQLYVFAGLSSPGQPDWCGAQVDVTGDLTIATNCWIFPAAHPTNGAVPVFKMRDLTVDAGSGFNTDAFGYSGATGVNSKAAAYGPGRPTGSNHGAGYGGAGTIGYRTDLSGSPGGVYGSADAPVFPGSGARAGFFGTISTYGGYGGGSVQVRAARAVTLNGTVTANGGGGGNAYGGGGSGGAIYITCKTFAGASSTRLRAGGGHGFNFGPNKYVGGAGGGGRIAVWRVRDESSGTVSNSVAGGFGWAPDYGITNAASGTIVYGWIPEDGTLITIR